MKNGLHGEEKKKEEQKPLLFKMAQRQTQLTAFFEMQRSIIGGLGTFELQKHREQKLQQNETSRISENMHSSAWKLSTGRHCKTIDLSEAAAANK